MIFLSMSISLSQKTDKKFCGIYRWLFAFMMTDEIFAVASQEKSVKRSFFAGLCVCPYLGWTMGTLFGALLGNVLPERLMSALSLAIYGMFVAIVVPEMKKAKSVVVVVVIAFLLSCMFRYLPLLQNVSGGLSISICAILAAVIGAWLFPIEEDEDEEY